MKITLRIKFLSGEERDVVCSASDLVKFEDKFNISVARIESDLRISYLLFLAWSAETRLRLTDKTFEQWVELVESVGAADTPK